MFININHFVHDIHYVYIYNDFLKNVLRLMHNVIDPTFLIKKYNC